MGFRVKPEKRRTGVIQDKARELEFSATGRALEALDGGAVIGEEDYALSVRNAVRNIHHAERRVLKFHAAAELRRAPWAAHRGIGGDRAGGDQVAAEIMQHAQIE